MFNITQKLKNLTKIQEGIISTLAFFGILDIPLTAEKVWQMLYKTSAPKDAILGTLNDLVAAGLVYQSHGYHSLKLIKEARLLENQAEIQKRWQRIGKYYWLLSLIPFVEHISVINSLAMGNATTESDIDFFVVTKPRRLYFVRSIIILVFRLLGIYKTKNKIKDQFCFGFYVTTDGLDLSSCLIEGQDPHFAFWFASFKPLFGKRAYERLVAKNRWVYDYCPNFLPSQKINDYIERPKWTKLVRRMLEIILYLPAVLLEPAACWVHIRHTFRLPENHWPTATTIAETNILKLHAVDPRKQIRERFFEILRQL